MVDRQKLEAWIQPQHLEDTALEQYRKSFTSHPARLVVIKNFLQPQMAERLSRFLSSEAEFKAEYGLYSVEGGVKEEDWLRAKDEDRFFKFGKLVGTPPQFQTSPNALAYLQFRTTFQRPELKAWKPEFGGQLKVTHLDGRTTVVEAEYNSVIAFNVLTHKAHVVEPVRQSNGVAPRRLTIGGWYHKLEAASA